MSAISPEPVRSGARRRGRRPAGQQTRDGLIAAARAEFSAQGYQGARVRSIAEAAGVDAAMVNHWFGGKSGLFVAAMDLPVDPDALVETVLDGPDADIGERMVRLFLSAWDPVGGGAFVAMLRSVTSHEDAARMVREFVTEVFFGRVTARVAPDRSSLRAGLCGSQMVGLGMARYVVKLQPLASAGPDEVAGLIGPTLRRYLTEPLP